MIETPQYILMTRNAPIEDITEHVRSNSIDVPCIGATGILTHYHGGNGIITWDKDNPVSNEAQESQIPTNCFKIIDETEYNRRKFLKRAYPKKYVRDIFNLDIPETNIKFVHGMTYDPYFFRHSQTHDIVYLGCRFIQPLFTMSDMKGVYFINCIFVRPSMMAPKPLYNRTFISCDGIDPDNVPHAF